MKLGMTGTRRGLTTRQLYYARTEIPWNQVQELHSGDCIGADTSLHSIAVEKGVKSIESKV